MDITPVSRRLIAAGFPPEQARQVANQNRINVASQTILQAVAGTPRFVVSGWLLAQHRLGGGVMQTLQIFMLGDLIDASAGMLPTMNLVALTASSIAHVPGDISHSAGFKRLEAADQAAKAVRFLEHIVRLGRYDAQQRMCHFLLEIDTRWRAAYAQQLEPVPFPFKQPDIADYLALSSVHVNRTLMALRKAGLVDVVRGRLVIEKRDALKRASVQRVDLAASLNGDNKIAAN